MDTTPEYIKMCDAAEEIHAISHLHQDRTDYWYCGNCLVSDRLHALEVHKTACKKWWGVWLPQQDDLQEMWAIHEYGNERANNWTTFVLDQFSYWVLSGEAGLSTLDVSMEQLWLAFVMKELHNKVWNGTDWIVK